MGILSNISGKQAVSAFAKAGWRKAGQGGSHLVMTKPGVKTNLSIPQHRELGPGLMRSLIHDAGMSVKEFLELL
jgi:predicted RNA binding protein YcfA (HicA-like mRNA interferase family)